MISHVTVHTLPGGVFRNLAPSLSGPVQKKLVAPDLVNRGVRAHSSLKHSWKQLVSQPLCVSQTPSFRALTEACGPQRAGVHVECTWHLPLWFVNNGGG